MAQATRSITMGERLHWDDFIRPWLVRLAFVAVGLLIGTYIIAPQRARASDTYIPAAYSTIPLGVAQFSDADGAAQLLPVRLADSSTARAAGFNGVGPAAVGNTFMLYALSRETTRSTSYDMKQVRIPLDVAVFDASGAVVALHSVLPEGESLSVTQNHRWLLVARRGALEAYGIGEGTMLDVESVRKLNF